MSEELAPEKFCQRLQRLPDCYVPKADSQQYDYQLQCVCKIWMNHFYFIVRKQHAEPGISYANTRFHQTLTSTLFFFSRLCIVDGVGR